MGLDRRPIQPIEQLAPPLGRAIAIDVKKALVDAWPNTICIVLLAACLLLREIGKFN
jgi:hypothetical protein